MEEKDIKVGTKLHFANGASATIIYMTDDGYYSMLEYVLPPVVIFKH